MRTINLALTALTLILAVKAEMVVSMEAFKAVSKLSVGLKEERIKDIMLPVSLDWGRITWGGTGRGRLYFQIGEKAQIWVDIGSGPNFEAITIGPIEPKQEWERIKEDEIWVEGIMTEQGARYNSGQAPDLWTQQGRIFPYTFTTINLGPRVSA